MLSKKLILTKSTLTSFFDGAANVQLGGKILEVIYLRSYSLHGGEHVISLFFNDLAKLKPIKVGFLLLCLCIVCLLFVYWVDKHGF